MVARKDSVKIPVDKISNRNQKNKPKPTPSPVPKGDPKRNEKMQKGLAPKPKGNSAVTYNVRVKPKGPQSMLAAPYKIEKRTVKTSRGR